ncbi:hypothetical protein [Marinilabilia salmonicolor]|uniref:hypothetical protein n=1 Tax=Marinilabilia salmonicolor TaxID=989 RepID=UPI00029A30DC|nr:hypothetical protein [Marinilabilia salmonicolor]
MALIDKSPDVAEIMNALGTSSSNIQTLCQHPNINKWARYKPVNAPNYRMDVPFNELDNGMKYANYGLIPKELPNIVKASITGIGGATVDDPLLIEEWGHQVNLAPHRLGDFRGYNKDAVPFIKNVLPVKWYSLIESLEDISWYPDFRWGDGSQDAIGANTFNMEIPLNRLNINGLDFETSEWRLGLAIINSHNFANNGSKYYIASSVKAIKDFTDPSDLFVKFHLDYNLKLYLDHLTELSAIHELTAIPFIAYNLEYVEGAANPYFEWLSNGRAFCFPGGEQSIKFRVYGGSFGLGLQAGIMSVKFIIDGNTTHYINWSGTSLSPELLDKPTHQLTSEFTIMLTNDTDRIQQIDISKLRNRLGPTIESIGQAYYNNTDDNSDNNVYLSPGEGKVIKITCYESNTTSSTPFIDMFSNMPYYSNNIINVINLEFGVSYDGYSIPNHRYAMIGLT